MNTTQETIQWMNETYFPEYTTNPSIIDFKIEKESFNKYNMYSKNNFSLGRANKINRRQVKEPSPKVRLENQMNDDLYKERKNEYVEKLLEYELDLNNINDYKLSKQLINKNSDIN